MERKVEVSVLNCPYCEQEVEIWVLAEVAPAHFEETSFLEALVCEYTPKGRAYYQCDCGYQESLDCED